MDTRTLGYAAAVVAVFALIVAGALALGGDDEDPPPGAASDPATETGGGTTAPAAAAPDEAETETGAEPSRTEATEPAAEPQPEAEPAPEPARYTPYSGSSGDWQTVVPSGAGWQSPVESQRPSGGVRTTVRGPEGAVLLIDHTPDAAARFGSKYRTRRELPQPWFASMTEYRLADDAVGYLLNASEAGPGFRVFASGVDPAVARRVASRLTYVDL